MADEIQDHLDRLNVLLAAIGEPRDRSEQLLLAQTHAMAALVISQSGGMSGEKRFQLPPGAPQCLKDMDAETLQRVLDVMPLLHGSQDWPDSKITLIKMFRELMTLAGFGMGLKDAKDILDYSLVHTWWV